MTYKTIYAKCPYCKNEFPWINTLGGEYAPEQVSETCVKCGNLSFVSVQNIKKFSASKESQRRKR